MTNGRKSWKTIREAGPLEEVWPHLLAEIDEEIESIAGRQASGEIREELQVSIQDWWMTVSGALRIYLRCKAQGVSIDPDPVFLLERIARIAEELGNGNMPWLVRDAANNKRKLWLEERFAIAYAIFYIEACKDGRIADRAYNKTVSSTYNVTPKAVRGWLSRREDICRGVPCENYSAERLIKEMTDRGRIYARVGRGAPSS